MGFSHRGTFVALGILVVFVVLIGVFTARQSAFAQGVVGSPENAAEKPELKVEDTPKSDATVTVGGEEVTAETQKCIGTDGQVDGAGCSQECGTITYPDGAGATVTCERTGSCKSTGVAPKCEQSDLQKAKEAALDGQQVTFPPGDEENFDIYDPNTTGGVQSAFEENPPLLDSSGFTAPQTDPNIQVVNTIPGDVNSFLQDSGGLIFDTPPISLTSPQLSGGLITDTGSLGALFNQTSFAQQSGLFAGPAFGGGDFASIIPTQFVQSLPVSGFSNVPTYSTFAPPAQTFSSGAYPLQNTSFGSFSQTPPSFGTVASPNIPSSGGIGSPSGFSPVGITSGQFNQIVSLPSPSSLMFTPDIDIIQAIGTAPVAGTSFVSFNGETPFGVPVGEPFGAGETAVQRYIRQGILPQTPLDDIIANARPVANADQGFLDQIVSTARSWLPSWLGGAPAETDPFASAEQFVAGGVPVTVDPNQPSVANQPLKPPNAGFGEFLKLSGEKAEKFIGKVAKSWEEEAIPRFEQWSIQAKELSQEVNGLLFSQEPIAQTPVELSGGYIPPNEIPIALLQPSASGPTNDAFTPLQNTLTSDPLFNNTPLEQQPGVVFTGGYELASNVPAILLDQNSSVDVASELTAPGTIPGITPTRVQTQEFGPTEEGNILMSALGSIENAAQNAWYNLFGDIPPAGSGTIDNSQRAACDGVSCIGYVADKSLFEVGNILAPPAVAKPSTGDDISFRTTMYFPCENTFCKMNGDGTTARPDLSGKTRNNVHTLDDYRLGKSSYVTGAADPSRYKEMYEIPEITYRSAVDGKTYTLKDVPVYIHDTGGAFKGRPDKLDVAAGWSTSDSNAAALARSQPYLENTYNTLTAAGSFTGNTASDVQLPKTPPLPTLRPVFGTTPTSYSVAGILPSDSFGTSFANDSGLLTSYSSQVDPLIGITDRFSAFDSAVAPTGGTSDFIPDFITTASYLAPPGVLAPSASGQTVAPAPPLVQFASLDPSLLTVMSDATYGSFEPVPNLYAAADPFSRFVLPASPISQVTQGLGLSAQDPFLQDPFFSLSLIGPNDTVESITASAQQFVTNTQTAGQQAFYGALGSDDFDDFASAPLITSAFEQQQAPPFLSEPVAEYFPSTVSNADLNALGIPDSYINIELGPIENLAGYNLQVAQDNLAQVEANLSWLQAGRAAVVGGVNSLTGAEVFSNALLPSELVAAQNQLRDAQAYYSEVVGSGNAVLTPPANYGYGATGLNYPDASFAPPADYGYGSVGLNYPDAGFAPVYSENYGYGSVGLNYPNASFAPVYSENYGYGSVGLNYPDASFAPVYSENYGYGSVGLNYPGASFAPVYSENYGYGSVGLNYPDASFAPVYSENYGYGAVGLNYPDASFASPANYGYGAVGLSYPDASFAPIYSENYGYGETGLNYPNASFASPADYGYGSVGLNYPDSSFASPADYGYGAVGLNYPDESFTPPANYGYGSVGLNYPDESFTPPANYGYGSVGLNYPDASFAPPADYGDGFGFDTMLGGEWTVPDKEIPGVRFGEMQEGDSSLFGNDSSTPRDTVQGAAPTIPSGGDVQVGNCGIPTLAGNFMRAESNCGEQNSNPLSSVQGPLHYLCSTWQSYVQMTGVGNSDCRYRNDPVMSTQVTNAANTLFTQRYGSSCTGAGLTLSSCLYSIHVFGEGGFKKMFTAYRMDPGASASILRGALGSAAYDNNKSIFTNGGTVAGTFAELDRRLGVGSGSGRVPIAVAATQPVPIFSGVFGGGGTSQNPIQQATGGLLGALQNVFGIGAQPQGASGASSGSGATAGTGPGSAAGGTTGSGPQQSTATTQPPQTQLQPPRLSCAPQEVAAESETRVTIGWTCFNSTSATAIGFEDGERVPASGEVQIRPTIGANTDTIRFGVRCSNGTERLCSVSVLRPVITFISYPDTVSAGSSARLTWASTGGIQECSLYSPLGLIARGGAEGTAPTGALTHSTEFMLSCAVSGGASATSSIAVRVLEDEDPPLKSEAPIENSTSGGQTQTTANNTTAGGGTTLTNVQTGEAVNFCDPQSGIIRFTWCLLSQ